MIQDKNMQSKNMSGYCLVAATLLLGSLNKYAASTTLDKIKSSAAVTMGIRESSIQMSYTTGDNRFDSYHVEGTGRKPCDRYRT